ncbi:hypothetical protein HK096_003709 [Nowakowskiella sp. JEL0078]|nr:hypothetical protein HK096_003709 [Nowakowskiella sp. JEL0078]
MLARSLCARTLSRVSFHAARRSFSIAAFLRAERRYTPEHEWVTIEDGVGMLGITDYAQQSLGDVVFVELPQKGKKFAAGDVIGAVESVKAASDIYTPFSGTIIENNTELESKASLLNSAPYEKGWIAKIKLDDISNFDSLLSEEEYKKHIGS